MRCKNSGLLLVFLVRLCHTGGVGNGTDISNTYKDTLVSSMGATS